MSLAVFLFVIWCAMAAYVALELFAAPLWDEDGWLPAYPARAGARRAWGFMGWLR